MRPKTSSRSPSNSPLVSATFSNKKSWRPRSRTTSCGRACKRRFRTPTSAAEQRNEVALDENHNLDTVRSKSEPERPDDIIDMQERYSGQKFSQGGLSMSRSREDGQRTLKPAQKLRENRDDNDSIYDSFRTRDDARESPSSDQDSIHNYEDYIFGMFEKLQIKEVLEGLQGLTPPESAFQCESAKSTPQGSVPAATNTQDLEMKLQQESKRSRQLEDKLVSTQRLHEKESKEQSDKILALESKLAMQERMFASQLEAEKQRYALEANEGNDRCQSLTTTDDEQHREIEELRAANASLQTSYYEKQNYLESNLASANGKIQELEEELLGVEQELESQRALNKRIEMELEKVRGRLDPDARKNSTSETYETRAHKLLVIERKKNATLTALNDRMKIAMRKLNKKLSGQDNSGDKDMQQLRKQLQEKDSQIALVKNILNKNIDKKIANIFEPETQPTELPE